MLHDTLQQNVKPADLLGAIPCTDLCIGFLHALACMGMCMTT